MVEVDLTLQNWISASPNGRDSIYIYIYIYIYIISLASGV